jgi:hypothetical protein
MGMDGGYPAKKNNVGVVQYMKLIEINIRIT